MGIFDKLKKRLRSPKKSLKRLFSGRERKEAFERMRRAEEVWKNEVRPLLSRLNSTDEDEKESAVETIAYAIARKYRLDELRDRMDLIDIFWKAKYDEFSSDKMKRLGERMFYLKFYPSVILLGDGEFDRLVNILNRAGESISRNAEGLNIPVRSEPFVHVGGLRVFRKSAWKKEALSFHEDMHGAFRIYRGGEIRVSEGELVDKGKSSLFWGKYGEHEISTDEVKRAGRRIAKIGYNFLNELNAYRSDIDFKILHRQTEVENLISSSAYVDENGTIRVGGKFGYYLKNLYEELKREWNRKKWDEEHSGTFEGYLNRYIETFFGGTLTAAEEGRIRSYWRERVNYVCDIMPKLQFRYDVRVISKVFKEVKDLDDFIRFVKREKDHLDFWQGKINEKRLKLIRSELFKIFASAFEWGKKTRKELKMEVIKNLPRIINMVVSYVRTSRGFIGDADFENFLNALVDEAIDEYKKEEEEREREEERELKKLAKEIARRGVKDGD